MISYFYIFVWLRICSKFVIACMEFLNFVLNENVSLQVLLTWRARISFYMQQLTRIKQYSYKFNCYEDAHHWQRCQTKWVIKLSIKYVMFYLQMSVFINSWLVIKRCNSFAPAVNDGWNTSFRHFFLNSNIEWTLNIK